MLGRYTLLLTLLIFYISRNGTSTGYIPIILSTCPFSKYSIEYNYLIMASTWHLMDSHADLYNVLMKKIWTGRDKGSRPANEFNIDNEQDCREYKLRLKNEDL